jgi:hypothetical protein
LLAEGEALSAGARIDLGSAWSVMRAASFN